MDTVLIFHDIFSESPTSQQTKNVVSHFLKFNQSYKSLEGLLNLVNETPGAHYQIPTTTYKIKKLIDPLVTAEYHIKCFICKTYSSTVSNKVLCEKCCTPLNRADSNFFIFLPFTAQLKKYITEHFEKIISYNKCFDGNSDFVRDVQSGYQFQNCKKKYSKSFVLSLTVNTDGVQIFNSTKKSVWPIQVHQNYLPPTIRYHPKNVIVVALHDGKPNMRDFFHPFLKELKQINEAGGISMEKKGELYTFLPLITSCTADLPAKAEVQGMIGHGGYFGCGYCLHTGDLIKKNKNSKAVIRFVAKDYSIRTHKDTLSTYIKLRSTPINGVKSISCMIAACDFDLINGFSIDYMHCALLGTMRHLMDLWLNTENHAEAFYISNKRQVVLSNRILSIKPNAEIARKPRSVFERKNFKANEFRTLLLYYLRYSLVDLLPIRYIEHFQLFSSAIYALLKETISTEDIFIAEAKLNQFSDQFEKLYGVEHVRINLHLLRHMGSSVRYLGPLWAQSSFTFEMNNGIIVKANNATKNFLHNLSWKYVLKNSLQNETEKKNNQTIEVGGKINIQITLDEFPQISELGINFTDNIIQAYTFVSFCNTRFTSLMSKVTSTADFFVKLCNDKIGSVKYFVVKNNNAYAFVNIYYVEKSYDHLLEIQPTGLNQFFNINEISEKMLYMKIGKYEIATTFPNKYEQS